MKQTTASPPAMLWMGLVAAAAGLFIVLLAAGVIPADDSQFQAPRWVAGLAGLVFLLGGGSLLSQALMARVGGSERVLYAVQSLFGISIVLVFAVLANWIAFGPGERRFEGSISIPFVGFFFESPELPGRIVFGIGAVLLDLVLVFLLLRGVRAVRDHLAGTAPGQV